MSTKKPLAAIVTLAGVLLVPAFASAQDTSLGTLTVTADVQGSIKLTFESDPAGVALAGAGTNAATLDFGVVAAYETPAANVTHTLGTTDFTVSSLFGVKVVKANSTSGSYTLEAALGTTDSTNTWKINAVTLSTTDQPLGSTYAYGSAQQHTLALTIPMTAAATISNTVAFTATAN